MRTLLVLVLVGVMAACSSTKQARVKLYFRLISATEQMYYGGRQESGMSIEYRFQLIALGNFHVVFDSLWIDGKSLGLKYSWPYWDKKGALEMGDTVHLVTNHKIGDHFRSINSPVPRHVKALLGYHNKKVRRYFEVIGIKNLPPVSRP